MRLRAVLAAATLAVAALSSAASAQPSCVGLPCDLINRVCRTAGGGDCVG
ncbi:MAG TPA: hypothetical protein VFQ85_14280 [Mycobacteriales bacterium]|jgi:hypothetical protein|nr:hypothetical protein [Mycobacteriales bacterium]